ncbi:MAG: carboxylate-amine ligase [Pseudolabrys sp.]|nr:carboxylate-amine ligase [Pseudolabrys sp.]MBV9260417.1 carboxylate-amine ligase [Pseudolabrys sp.]
MYSIGIEEEFFVFDLKTRRAANRADKTFLAEAKRCLGDRVMTEMLQSQIEVATPPCEAVSQARQHLAGYRTTLGKTAASRSLGIAAVGTFPLARWSEQTLTPKARYDVILDDLQMIGRRNMLCGMHVHVEVPDVSTRVDLMMRLSPYLPLLLALSTSSPFWQEHMTGLRGYRLAAYDELPRTGLPPLLRTQEDYREFVDALVGARVIPDESYIWWAIRPARNFPTIELRVADSCTSIDDAAAIAALFQCLVRALDRDRALNAGFDRVGRAITIENKWHAQRYGIAATFVDPFRRMPITTKEWLDEVLDFVAEDVGALRCQNEIERLSRILDNGTSADRQIVVYEAARNAGQKRLTALKQVVDWVGRQTLSV